MMRLICMTLLGLSLADAAYACRYKPGPPGSEFAVAQGEGIVWAEFSDATERYRHGVYGEKIEAGVLRASTADKGPCELAVVLDENNVFEDRTPRIADMNGDGKNDVVVIETNVDLGASIAVYSVVDGELKKIAATANIGLPARWLAPVGIADFNADGYADIAYIETPHIGGTLRIWSMRRSTKLQEIAQVSGLSNHRIGDDLISGGVRACKGERPMMIALDNAWTRIMGVTLRSGRPIVEEIGPYEGPASLASALKCG